MSDYISRQAAIKKYCENECGKDFNRDSCGCGDDCATIFDDIPAADVRENVKAHWIDMKPTGDSRFMCSRCKGKEKVPTIMGEPIVWDYCPNCGAQMER